MSSVSERTDDVIDIFAADGTSKGSIPASAIRPKEAVGVALKIGMWVFHVDDANDPYKKIGQVTEIYENGKVAVRYPRAGAGDVIPIGNIGIVAAMPADACGGPKQSPPEDRSNYRPEFAYGWEAADTDDQHAYQLLANGRLIATISMEPSFDFLACYRIATLMAHAPALWRSLLEAANSQIDNSEGMPAYLNTLQTLWSAVDRFPFEYPAEHPDNQLFRDTTSSVEEEFAKAGAK